MDSIQVASYSIDLGNGFAKRVLDGTCLVEPSVLADAETYFSEEAGVTKLRMDEDSYFVGDDVTNIGLKPRAALGENDRARYSTNEFKRLMFGFIAKDFKEDVTIQTLVTGLPVQHYKREALVVRELLEGRTVVHINDKDIIIDIKKVSVVPQPIGTYLHLVAKKLVTPNKDMTLIVDCGHGTLDITELKGKTIVKRAGNNEGAKEAYLDIYNLLCEEYGALKSLSIANIPNILHDGLLIGGRRENVKALKDVQRILRKHFESIFTFLQDNKFDLRSYDKVVFTGGIVHLYKEYFNERMEPNFLVLEDGQTANVRGYYEFGKVLATK